MLKQAAQTSNIKIATESKEKKVKIKFLQVTRTQMRVMMTRKSEMRILPTMVGTCYQETDLAIKLLLNQQYRRQALNYLGNLTKREKSLLPFTQDSSNGMEKESH